MSFEHGTNCHYWDEHDLIDCTCGLEWRIKLQTEREMHNAWRKRATEAEQRLAAVEAKYAVLLECVRMYADKDNWGCSVEHDEHFRGYDCDAEPDKCCLDVWQGPFGVHGYEGSQEALRKVEET